MVSQGEFAAIEVKQNVSQRYAVRYLSMFNKTAVCSEKVRITMSSTSPIVVAYDLGKLGEIKYYLAPRKADEDES